MPFTRRTVVRSGFLSWLPSLFATGASARENPTGVLRELGIRPVINCRGTHTVIGASKERPEIHEAMREVSRHFVVLDELQAAVAARLSKHMGCEDAMVTTGAAGAITLGSCAALTGTDEAKVRRLPDLTGMKTEIIIQKVHRNGYDHAARNTGVKIVEVENRDQLLNASGERTAMMYYLGGSSGDYAWETPVKLEECLAIARKAGYPVMVDAANMLPPWDNIRKLSAAGVDMIALSGGKHIRGPQCSGILAGRKDLIQAARLNSSPHSDSLGRGLKVGREEIVGLWRAVEEYVKTDFEALDRQFAAQADYLERELKKIDGMNISRVPHDRTRRVHRVLAQWDESRLGMTRDQCEKQLMDGDPRIAVLHEGRGLVFTMFMNDPGDEKIAARRMQEIFRENRSAKA